METLIGKKFKYIDGDRKFDALVQMADDDIGYTVVDDKDHEHELVCSNGPLSPTFHDYEGAEESWLASKELLKKAIKDGEWNINSEEDLGYLKRWDDDWNILVDILVDMLEDGYFNAQELPSESGGAVLYGYLWR